MGNTKTVRDTLTVELDVLVVDISGYVGSVADIYTLGRSWHVREYSVADSSWHVGSVAG